MCFCVATAGDGPHLCSASSQRHRRTASLRCLVCVLIWYGTRTASAVSYLLICSRIRCRLAECESCCHRATDWLRVVGIAMGRARDYSVEYWRWHHARTHAPRHQSRTADETMHERAVVGDSQRMASCSLHALCNLRLPYSLPAMVRPPFRSC